MEPLDAAFDKYRSLHKEIAGYINSVETESDTRLKIIDRILIDVLAWPYESVFAEKSADGGFADYMCTVGDRNRLVVEAKKDGRSLGCESRTSGSSFKLSGPAFRAGTVVEGIQQAVRYCGAKNAELACVTNGREWIVLRGNRLGDGLDSMDGSAFVFPNLVAVEERFDLFFNLLSYESASRFGYRPYFQEAEGQPIRSTVFNKSYRQPNSARFLPGSELAADIDKIMSSFFQRLTGDDDPDLIEACFVATAESHHADDQLVKIADSIVTRIRTLNTGTGGELTTLIDRVHTTKRHEFVLVVGTKGAGKSTFVTRFFKSVLPRATAERCVVIRVDLRTTDGDIEKLFSWLDRALVKECETALFEGGPSFAEIEGMFFDEYQRLRKGPWKVQYDSDKPGFQSRFGDRIEEMRHSDPSAYIQGLIRHIVNNRLSVPVLVFDNADHFDIEFQQRVYQYARSIYERAVCLVVLPITDRTSWQLTKHGALQSFEHEALFLPAPPTDDIIRKRIDFIDRRIDLERERGTDKYFTSRGISLDIKDITAFARSLQRVFLQTSDVSRWIGDLANHDVRRTLNLAKVLISSPHLRVDDLVSAYLAGSAIDVQSWRVVKALVRGHYDIYPSGQQDYIQNIFSLNADLATTPFLGVRILQLLSDVPKREHEGSVIEVSEIVAYFGGMNVENRAVLLWLDEMLKTGLILNYDPTVQEIDHASQIEISPAGKQHLFWAQGNHEYLSAMADVTPLLVEGTFSEMMDHRRPNEWRLRTSIFIDYMLREDEMYCEVPKHDAYQSQARVRELFSVQEQRLRDWAARPTRPFGRR